jgi:hypothetical protein
MSVASTSRPSMVTSSSALPPTPVSRSAHTPASHFRRTNAADGHGLAIASTTDQDILIPKGDRIAICMVTRSWYGTGNGTK